MLEREADAREGAFELAKVDVDANLQVRYQVQGIPAVKAVPERAGRARVRRRAAAGRVARFLDELTGPSATEQLVAELESSGELPGVVAALEQDEHEHALELLLPAVTAAAGERRERLLALTVAVFGELGHEHPLTMRYRRRTGRKPLLTPDDVPRQFRMGSRASPGERSLNAEVDASASETHQRNHSIPRLLQSYGRIDRDPTEAIDLYTRQASPNVSARDPTVMGATLSAGAARWSPRARGGPRTFVPPLDDAGHTVKGRLAASFRSRRLGLDIFVSKPER